MNKFMKDIKELAKQKTSERVIASYEQGLITIDEAVSKMKGLADVVDLVKDDEKIMSLVK